MTKKEMFNEIIKVAVSVGNNDIADFAKKEIALIEKRNVVSVKAQQAKEAEREALAASILETIEQAVEPIRTTNIAAAVGISPQKATPILRMLAADGRVVTLKEKGTKVYTINTDLTDLDE